MGRWVQGTLAPAYGRVTMASLRPNQREDGERLGVNRCPAEQGVASVLFSAKTIARTVHRLGGEISRHYPQSGSDEVPLLVGILTGSAIFVADLLRAIEVPVELDFMALSSYGDATSSSGVVRLLKDLSADIAGRHVILVEDIVDSGLTVAYLRDTLALRRPASLAVCSLLDKPQARTRPVDIEFVGLACPDAFVVGYGLDYAGKYRNLPYVGVLADPSESSEG